MKLNPDDVIALAIHIYNEEGGEEGTFQILNYEDSHAYCVKAEKMLAERSNPSMEQEGK